MNFTLCIFWLVDNKERHHISHTLHFWLVDNNQVAYFATSSEAWPLLSSLNTVYIAKSVVAVASSTGCKHCKKKPELHNLQAVMWSPPPPKKKKKKISDEKPSLKLVGSEQIKTQNKRLSWSMYRRGQLDGFYTLCAVKLWHVVNKSVILITNITNCYIYMHAPKTFFKQIHT